MKVLIKNISRIFIEELDLPSVPRKGEIIQFQEYDEDDDISVITGCEATVQDVIYKVDYVQGGVLEGVSNTNVLLLLKFD